jgi:hypothetical protein
VTTKIDAILGEVVASRGELSEKLGEIGTGLKQARSEAQTSAPVPETISEEADVKAAFERMNLSTAFLATALYLARSHSLTDQELFDNYIWPAYTEAVYKPNEKSTPGMEKFFEGWYFGFLRLANALGWVLLSAKEGKAFKFALDSNFEAAAADFISGGPKLTGVFLKMYNILHQRLTESAASSDPPRNSEPAISPSSTSDGSNHPSPHVTHGTTPS